MQNRLTILIGRMSIFHNGHAELLERALLKSSNVLLLIGSSGAARNIKNPFTFEERKRTVSDWYNGQIHRSVDFGNLTIKPLTDQPYNDQAWIEEVQAAVVSIATIQEISVGEVYLTGADRDASSWYLKAFGSFFKLDLVPRSEAGFELNATDLRSDYFAGGHKYEIRVPDATAWFLDKFKYTVEYADLVAEAAFVHKYKESWKAAPYAPMFVTTDACVIQSGHVLLVERAAFPGRGLWALPGGFLEQHEKIIDGCIRELVEETSIELSGAQLRGSIKDKEVFDHPDRSTRGRTITHCFLFKLDDTKPLPKTKAQVGEVRKLQWVPIEEAKRCTDKWFEDHHAMFSTMISRIKN